METNKQERIPCPDMAKCIEDLKWWCEIGIPKLAKDIKARTLKKSFK